MDERQQKLPACFDCQFGAGFPCRGSERNLVCFHGEGMIGEIEREAAHTQRSRLLLSGIWAEPDVKPEIWRRIQDAVGEGPWLDEDSRTPQGSLKARKAH